MGHNILGVIINLKNNGLSSAASDNEIRHAAEHFLDIYEPDCDYFDIYDIGAFKDEYPNNVIRATDEKFFEIIGDIELRRKQMFNEHKADLTKTLEELTDAAKSGYDAVDELYKTRYAALCHLKSWMSLLLGEFTVDSEILDSETWNSKITEKNIEMYRENPENFAVVMADIHT